MTKLSPPTMLEAPALVDSPPSTPTGEKALIRSRGLSAALFAAALLAFLLPFGTVSCSEPPITFTGLELATATVHGDDEYVVGEIESQGTFVALVAGLAALVGGYLAVAGRKGQGCAASVGIVALLLLPWIGWWAWADFVAHSGYVLATGSLTAVVGIRAAFLLRERRCAGRRIWPAVTGLCLLAALLAVTAAGLIEASASVEAA
jgi:hypothetical protein